MCVLTDIEKESVLIIIFSIIIIILYYTPSVLGVRCKNAESFLWSLGLGLGEDNRI